MTVFFAYRSHYEGPTGIRVRRFHQQDAVLDWFRAHWQAIADPDEADERADELLGMSVYGFSSLFTAIAETSLPPPRTYGDLAELLEEHLYVEGEVLCSPHVVQALTDDDEIELAYYVFDDNFVAKHPGRTALLLQDDWKLPGDIGPGGFRPKEPTTRVGKGKGDGATYLVFHDCWDSGNLDALEGGYRIDGVRLPQLAQYLAAHEPPDRGCCFHYDMPALRLELFPKSKKARAAEDPFLFALRDNPNDEATRLIFADWLADRGQGSPGSYFLRRALAGVCRRPLAGYETLGHNAKKSLIQVDEHLAQLCRHVGRADKKDLYHRWIFFDDLWASAHPDLANSLLRYARRWDCLSPS
jgi:uncharacterized protein (TIGR02996 family)